MGQYWCFVSDILQRFPISCMIHQIYLMNPRPFLLKCSGIIARILLIAAQLLFKSITHCDCLMLLLFDSAKDCDISVSRHSPWRQAGVPLACDLMPGYDIGIWLQLQCYQSGMLILAAQCLLSGTCGDCEKYGDKLWFRRVLGDCCCIGVGLLSLWGKHQQYWTLWGLDEMADSLHAIFAKQFITKVLA